MPIPFHDTDEVDALGAAAFLHVEAPSPESGERLGALFTVNARGEPLEFVYNRIELVSTALWRPADRDLAAARRLALTLFHAAALTPSFLLCRARAVPPHLFGSAGQIAVEIPVGRIAGASEAVGYAGTEKQESVPTLDGDGQADEVHLFWTPGPPSGPASELLAALAERGFLLEPFERAALGLREVYRERPEAAR